MVVYFEGTASGRVTSHHPEDPTAPLLSIVGGPYAKVVCDSISADNHRVTTVVVKMAKRIQAELNTHHALNYNSASSRARPAKIVQHQTLADPCWPIDFGSAQRGMSSNLDSPVDADAFLAQWWEGCVAAVEQSTRLTALGVSKEECNRPLEAYCWTEVIITASDWTGFFLQRAHPGASAHLRAVAYAMRAALNASNPVFLQQGEWHLPFVDMPGEILPLETALRCSAARCARVSYVRHGEIAASVDNDLALFDTLVTRELAEYLTNPGHWSPLGHQVTPAPFGRNALGGITGFNQYRHLVEARGRDQLWLAEHAAAGQPVSAGDRRL